MEGIVAVGGNLSPGMLLSAYRQGLFPWFSEGDPILWWSPEQRFVLRPERYHLSKSLAKFLRKRPFRFSCDSAFRPVIHACATTERPGQSGTWLTMEMIDAYVALHELGYAHSLEVWRGDDLVGGLYGVVVGSVFAGESMFSLADNASKAALALLCAHAKRAGVVCIDCQIATDHVRAAGGEEMGRSEYLAILKRELLHDRFGDLWERRSNRKQPVPDTGDFPVPFRKLFSEEP